MMNQDQQTYQRAAGAALLGLAVQVLIAAGLGFLALWTGHDAIKAAAWHALGGLGIWVCLWIVYQQHKLERIEALEAEQLARTHGADSSIFEVTADDLSVARRRLRWLYRWVVPLASLVTATYLVVMGLWLASGAKERLAAEHQLLTEQVGVALAVCAALAIVAFLVSRYLAGMAKVPQWKALRGGASYLVGSVLFGAALVLCLALAHFEFPLWLVYLGLVIPVLMILIGIEMGLNLLLDFYRPRKVDEMPRPAFDSRLLGLLTTPESIAKTIGEALNYQFGFEITRSWFWQLLSRTVGWLVVFGIFVMWLLSSLVLVEPHQQALVNRFGRAMGSPLDPGLHFKMPWPIDQVRWYDVSGIRTLHIGSEAEAQHGVGAVLWANEHAKGSSPPLIVALPPVEGGGPQGARVATDSQEKLPVSIALVNAEIDLDYSIRDLMAYVRGYADPDGQLRDIAQQQTNLLMLSGDVDHWIGAGRVGAAAILKQRIQQAADEASLGLVVQQVSIASIHPPQEVAKDFHAVVVAEQERQTSIEYARRQSVQILAETAGSMGLAQKLEQAIDAYRRLADAKASADQLDVAQRAIDLLLDRAGGKAAVEIAEARGYRWVKENDERGKADRFEYELQAYRRAPQLYAQRRYLQVLGEGLAKARVFLLAADRGRLEIRGDFTEISSGFGAVLEESARKESGDDDK